MQISPVTFNFLPWNFSGLAEESDSMAWIDITKERDIPRRIELSHHRPLCCFQWNERIDWNLQVYYIIYQRQKTRALINSVVGIQNYYALISIRILRNLISDWLFLH